MKTELIVPTWVVHIIKDEATDSDRYKWANVPHLSWLCDSSPDRIDPKFYNAQKRQQFVHPTKD